MKSDLRASSITRRNIFRRRYLSRDGKWFKSHLICDIESFYCRKIVHIKNYCKERLKAIRYPDEGKKVTEIYDLCED